MYSVPTNIQIGDKSMTIRNQGDYRMVIDCFNILQDLSLSQQERILFCLGVFYNIDDLSELNDIDITEAANKMFEFFNCGSLESPGLKTKHKLIDWEKDEQLICSAINAVVHTEIRLMPYVHWWTFMSYYNAIGESALSTVVTIRNKIATNKKLEKYEQKFRAENPQYFNIDMRTIEQKDTEAIIMSMWNKG